MIRPNHYRPNTYKARTAELPVTGHTPGPWLIQAEFDDEPIYIVTKDKQQTDADDEVARLPVASEEAHANARLIAAAPDLLEALKQCLEHIRIDMREAGFSMDDIATHPDIVSASQAIAKATGQELSSEATKAEGR